MVTPPRAKLLNISRLDYERTHAWWVRFQRGSGTERRVVSKMFSDALHGGKRKALLAAQLWRDRMAPKVPRSQRRSELTVPPGYGYVKRRELLRRSSRQACYVAWLRVEDGCAKSTSRSVRVYGERGAKADAELWLLGEQRALRARLRGGKNSSRGVTRRGNERSNRG
ncbi:MAG: hypothetical protein RL685_1570 [Pseudomonadota bacterium]